MNRYIHPSQYDRRYIISEPVCHQLKIFNWLRAYGTKNRKWFCYMPKVRYNKVHIIQFHFHDADIEALFKLTFGDHFIDLSPKAYADLFFKPRILPDT